MSNTTTARAPLSERLRDVADCVTASRRAFADLAINTFEQAVDNVVELERAAADATGVDWLKEAVVVRGALLHEVKLAYVRLARAVLA